MRRKHLDNGLSGSSADVDGQARFAVKEKRENVAPDAIECAKNLLGGFVDGSSGRDVVDEGNVFPVANFNQGEQIFDVEFFLEMGSEGSGGRW